MAANYKWRTQTRLPKKLIGLEMETSAQGCTLEIFDRPRRLASVCQNDGTHLFYGTVGEKEYKHLLIADLKGDNIVY